MTQKELARLLGVSEALVSKHSKIGMPTDSLERAVKWRKRHLEPGRVKGSRFDPKGIQASPGTQVASAPTATPRGTVNVVEVEAAALNSALAKVDQDAAAKHLAHLRGLLRELPDTAQPKFSLRVWLALVDYVLHDTAEVRNVSDLEEIFTPAEFGKRAAPAHALAAWLAIHCLDHARDRSGFSITGFPDGPDDE